MQKAEESSTHDPLSGHADLPGSLDENGSFPAKDALLSFADHAPIPVRFGRRLRSLRLERGLTQVQLSDHLGIDRPFLSDVERGKKAMTLSYLEPLRRALTCLSRNYRTTCSYVPMPQRRQS